MFKIFNVSDDDHAAHHDSTDVHIEDGDVIEGEQGQVALDILEKDNAIVIIAPLAGLEIEDISISISRNILTISGERKRPSVYDESNSLLVQECFFGPFSRSIILPENLGFNKIHADMENNLLRVEIPKLQTNEKTIKINKLES